MTISITSTVFGIGATGTGKISQALIDEMNRSPTFIKLFESVSPERLEIKITVGVAGGGTSFFDKKVTIDLNDFTRYAAEPKVLVARIGHELAHAADSITAKSIAGTDGLTTGAIDSKNLSPADYSLSRAKDEGFALFQEFLIAKDLKLKAFSADSGIDGSAIPGLFERMDAIYTAFKASGVSDAATAKGMTFVAGAAGRDLIPSTNGGSNAGLSYGQKDIKDFIIENLDFKDAAGKPIPSENYPTSYIVGYQQDDNGSFRISAIDPTTLKLVSKDYFLSADGKTKVLDKTTTETLNDFGEGSRLTVYDDGRPSLNQITDSSGAVTPLTPRTPLPPQNWWKKRFSEAVDSNGDGTPDAVVSAAPSAVTPDAISITPMGGGLTDAPATFVPQIFPDGSSLVTVTSATGAQTFISSDVDGAYRVTTTLSDNNVTFSATKDSGGVLRLTGIAEVNGLPPDEGTLAVVNASLVEGQFTPADVINRPGAVLQLVETSDRTNPDGNVNTALTTLTGRTDWWNDSRVASLAGDTVGLIAALRSGKPLPIATAGFSFAANQLNDPVLAEIAGALSGITSLAGLVKALEKGDIGRILIDGGGVARSAVTLYASSLSQQLISQYGSVTAARLASDQFGELAADLVPKLDGAKALLEGLGQAIAVLNIINSIANGDIKGAVIAAIAFIPGWRAAVNIAADGLMMQSEALVQYKNKICLRASALTYSTNTYLKTASNDAFWRVAV